MIIDYIKITKPTIILGNIIAVIGGFLLASKGTINYLLFFFTILGVSIIIASSCVFNNYIDRDIDSKMERTKNRVLVKKTITPQVSLIYATILSIIGFTILYLTINILTFYITIVGFIIYVYVYSLCLKKYTAYSMFIGSLSGAIPPIIGYCAVTNHIDIGSIILFLIFIFWQIPHFYAISIIYFNDYKNASIPILTMKYDIKTIKQHIILCIIGFNITCIMLKLNGYTGYKYLVITTIINNLWLMMAIKNYLSINNEKLWSQKLFIFSIITIIIFSIMISTDFTYL